MEPPNCIVDLHLEESFWDKAFEEACKNFQKNQTWVDCLATSFTQDGKWRGAWKRAGIQTICDEIILDMPNAKPPTIEHTEGGTHTLLTAFVEYQHTAPPKRILPYHQIEGDLHFEGKAIEAPNLTHIHGHLNLEKCESASFPNLKTIGGHLCLPTKQFHSPKLQCVGEDLVLSGAPNPPGFPQLEAIGGSLLDYKNQKAQGKPTERNTLLCFPSLLWVENKINLPNTETLQANKLYFIGRELSVPKAKTLQLAELQHCGIIQECPCTHSHLPNLKSCHWIPKRFLRNLPPSNLKEIQKSRNLSKNFQEYLKEEEKYRIKTLRALSKLQKNLTHDI